MNVFAFVSLTQNASAPRGAEAFWIWNARGRCDSVHIMERHIKIILGIAIGVAVVLLGALMYTNSATAPTAENAAAEGGE